MARQAGAKAIYEVAELFRQRCLCDHRSLLWPDSEAWTPENISSLYAAFMDYPDLGNESFFEKWRVQLAELPDPVHRVAADVVAFYFLFPSNIGREAKLTGVREVIGWKFGNEPPEFQRVGDALSLSIGNAGPHYLMGRPEEIAFYLDFARTLQTEDVDPFDANACVILADQVRQRIKGSSEARHILLHLLFPDRFERIAGGQHRKRILEMFADLFDGTHDEDKALAQIRSTLSAETGRQDLDFYDPDIRKRWIKPRVSRTWLFQANPDIYNLAEELKTRHVGDEDSWFVNRYRSEMESEQTVLLWQGGSKAGIYAIGELIDEPFQRPTADFWPDQEHRPPTEWAVPYRYTSILPKPIEKSVLQAHPILRNLQVLRAPQATNFKVTLEEWAALHHLIDGSADVIRPQPQVWIEKTITRGRQDRLSGDYAVGSMLWSPQRDKRGGDIYRFMREVQPGDIILHLTDNEAFTAVSRAAEAVEEFGGVPHTAWNEQPSYRIRLHSYIELKPPLRRDVFFASPYRERLVALINAGTRNLFFNQEPALNQGAYLTPAPPELVDILEDAYRSQAAENLIPTDWMQDRGASLDSQELAPESGSTLNQLAAMTHLDLSELEELEALLLDKRQLVLEGPPGSGKTYLATYFARYFAGLPLAGEDDERVETVQFHQSYGYEDFVQGIRPITTEAGQLQYHVVPGIFLRMCDLASRNPDQKFVLIIDEINRGNLSRIFGELLLLLEYRDKRVRLPYGAVEGQEGHTYLTIPRNLYLIGTMNSTDRSLALIDYALRRRFYFYRLLPVVEGQAPVLERWLATQGLTLEEQQRILRLFIQLNAAIEEHLSPDFQVGHSYFMRPDIHTDMGLNRVWQRAIHPLLEEYLHGVRIRESVLAGFTLDQLLARTPEESDPDTFDPDAL